MYNPLQEMATELAKELIKKNFPAPNTLPEHISSIMPFPQAAGFEARLPLIKEKTEPMPGSIIVTDLAVFFEHSGIYVGNGHIIHRHGDGYLEKVNKKAFQERLDGFNPAMDSYVACVGNKPFYLREAARRAREALAVPNHPEHSGYDLLNKNCHNFTRYCLTGDQDQWGLDFTFTSLQNLLIEKYCIDNWRLCKL